MTRKTRKVLVSGAAVRWCSARLAVAFRRLVHCRSCGDGKCDQHYLSKKLPDLDLCPVGTIVTQLILPRGGVFPRALL